MAYMGTPIVKRTILSVLSTDNEHTLGKVSTFAPYGPTGAFQLHGRPQIYGQFPLGIIPAVICSRFGGRRDTQQSLKKTSFHEFYAHVLLLIL
jgi:hypothetical protein